MYNNWNDKIKKEELKKIVDLVEQPLKVLVSDFYKNKSVGDIFCEIPQIKNKKFLDNSFLKNVLGFFAGVLSPDMIKDISLYINALITVETNTLEKIVWKDKYNDVEKYLNGEQVVFNNNAQLLLNILKKDDYNNFKYAINIEILSCLVQLGDEIRKINKKEENVFSVDEDAIVFLLNNKESWSIDNFSKTNEFYIAIKGSIGEDLYYKYFQKYMVEKNVNKIENNIKMFENLSICLVRFEVKSNEILSLKLIKSLHNKIIEQVERNIVNNVFNVYLLSSFLNSNYLKTNKELNNYLKEELKREDFKKSIKSSIKEDKIIITVSDELVFYRSLKNIYEKSGSLDAMNSLIKFEKEFFDEYNLKEVTNFDVTSRYMFKRDNNYSKEDDLENVITVVYGIYKAMINNINKFERIIVMNDINNNIQNEEKNIIEKKLDINNSISNKSSKKIKF